MKTLNLAQELDKTLNKLTHHSVSMERDNMLLKKVIRTMANKMYTDEHGNISMGLSQEDSEFIQNACTKCDVFNIGVEKK